MRPNKIIMRGGERKAEEVAEQSKDTNTQAALAAESNVDGLNFHRE